MNCGSYSTIIGGKSFATLTLVLECQSEKSIGKVGLESTTKGTKVHEGTQSVCGKDSFPAGDVYNRSPAIGARLHDPCCVLIGKRANMRSALSSFILIVAAGMVLSCGAPARQLQSITLKPPSADAKDFPSGKVPFVATGHYNTSPQTVTPIAATWGTCSKQLLPVNEVSVSSNGLAQCAPEASGTFTIWASDPAPLPPGTYNCPASTVCGGGCIIQATAPLTCP